MRKKFLTRSKKFLKKLVSNSSGFTLIEVLIATTVFSVFIAAYSLIQGNNMSDSTLMRREVLLENIANQVLNETIASPPKFSKSLLLNPEGSYKKFEENDFYEYRIEWHEFKVPDFNKLMAKEEDTDANTSTIQNMVFDNIKTNLEKKIWQIRVIVRERESKFPFELSTWILDHKVAVNIIGI